MEDRVLFVGNSYTFYNAVPKQVMHLATEAGRPLRTHTIAHGGAHLKLHWEETGARERIEAGGYQTVVLQDQSGGPLHDRARFEEYAPRLAREALAAEARLIWYQTWARARGHEAYRSRWSGGSPEEMTRLVREAYHDMASRVGGTVAPAGDAWLMALDEDPSLPLFDTDQHHAAPAGSHLSALVLAGVVAGVDPLSARYVPEGVREGHARVLRAAAARSLSGSS